MQIIKPIVLIGMMGSGKSLLGKKIATKFKIDFIDLDQEIQKKTNSTVKQLINENHETLKKHEYEIISNLLKKTCVISTGDSTIENFKAWNLLLNNSISIWLDPGFKTLMERLRPTENRPFLKENFTISDLYELYNKRKSRYQKAHIRVKKISTLNNFISTLTESLN